MMELKQLSETTMRIFDCESVDDLGAALMLVCKSGNIEKFAQFEDAVQDLSVDWMQKIFQYYEADRKEKKQDYTPKSMAAFVGRLIGDDSEIIDLCAGSGALTIQRWNQNHDATFTLYELDEQCIPYLVFNMMLRNIRCTIYRADVLQMEIYETYRILKGEKYGQLSIKSTV